MRRSAWIGMTVAALLIASPAMAQATGDAAPALPQADSSDDIVVSALRIPRDKLPTGVFWSYPSMLSLRIMRGNSELFMRCAMNITNPEWVRGIVDGEPNSATAGFLQGRINSASKGCYPPIRTAGITYSIAGSELNQSPMVAAIDRGVIVERVLKAYAPDASLGPEDTQDPAVRARFNDREGVRNRLRLPNDRDALVLAACLVREQPTFATRLLRSDPGSRLEKGLLQAMLVEGRSCLRGARMITIDPSLSRTYIVDAFYRWVVAARGVDSLIPRLG